LLILKQTSQPHHPHFRSSTDIYRSREILATGKCDSRDTSEREVRTVLTCPKREIGVGSVKSRKGDGEWIYVVRSDWCEKGIELWCTDRIR
jgi:hypothetical protein